MRSEYLRIGRVVRAHGVRGDVKLAAETDDPKRFSGMKSAFLERDGAFLPVSVGNVRLLNDGCVLHVAGYDTVEAAETLRGLYLCVDREHAVPLPEKAYFIDELIGCETFDTAGRAFGRITDVMQLPANDVYEIEGGKLMVPALKRVIAEADTKSGRVVFDAEALLEVGLFAD